MACYYPLSAYKSLTQKTPNGKTLIWFNKAQIDGPTEPIKLGCSQCFGCRMDRSRDWAVRCVHEAQLWENNAFITLTFNPESINEFGTLIKSDFQKFMKRLRKSHQGCEAFYDKNDKKTFPIRYFHCGEYGSELSRPHHHACLFNFHFPDRYHWKTEPTGVKLYRSSTLEKLWPFGYSTIGEVTLESAAYVARYITKKVNGLWKNEHYRRVREDTGEIYQLEPEYITMSRRPGIAAQWFDNNPGDVYPKDFITLNGKSYKTPKYYDKIYDNVAPDSMLEIKNKRKLAALLHSEDNTPARLRTRETVKKSQTRSLLRSYENASQNL